MARRLTRLELRWADVALQVFGCCTEPAGVILEHSQAGITAAAQDSSDHSRPMAVINGRAADTTRPGHGFRRAADGAVAGLQAQVGPTLRLSGVVSAAPLDRKAGAAVGAEGRRVRAAIGVGFGKGHVTSSTVHAVDSHCPILPARMASWGSEVILCALVEAITGDEMSRHAQPELAAAA